MQLYKNFSPIVSIILPTFNRAGLLSRAIDSVLSQTEKRFELVIIDDGSTDNTFEVVEKYLANHENIRYIKQQNMKLPIALNVGIQMASGEFVTFIGSDDEYKPEHIKLRLQFMKDNPDIDLIHGGIEIIGSPFVKDKNDLTKVVHISDCAVGGTFFGKRFVFTELNGFKNISYSEDSEFLERAWKKYSVEKVNFKTYIYHRDTEDSICNTV
jgi:glycosyltransferase involved in cell wall biosynthesis